MNIKIPNKEIIEAMNEVAKHILAFKKENAIAIKNFHERVKEVGMFSDIIRKF